MAPSLDKHPTPAPTPADAPAPRPRWSPFQQDLAAHCRARVPLLWVQSHEEERVLGEVREAAADPQLIRTPREVYTWSHTRGWQHPDGRSEQRSEGWQRPLELVGRVDRPAIVVLHDFHPPLRGAQPDAKVVRLLRDLVPLLKRHGSPVNVVVVSPLLAIPEELTTSVAQLDFPLPDQHRLLAILDGLLAGNPLAKVDPALREAIAQAALGLTAEEAETAFSLAVIRGGGLDASSIAEVTHEKRRVIARSGVLELVDVEAGFTELGGLGELKAWLAKREGTWSPEAARWGVDPPKGVLVTGVPGCGKSLTAKATAQAWGVPLLRLDVGRIFDSAVGSSESNMRQALQVAEVVAPCVLWVDEVEKGFAGATGPSTDSGTAARVFGTFLTWLQERRSPVFVVATSNDADVLPPEFLRKGRFDEVFFVDLPTREERERILAIHLARRLRDPEVAGALAAPPAAVLRRLAELGDGYSGAELEQCVVSALLDAFGERRALREADLERAIAATVPLCMTQAEKLGRIRDWARSRAVPASAATDDPRTTAEEHP